MTTAAEAGLVAGCLALAAVFAVAVPLNAARVALAIQLQPARMFWMLDLLGDRLRWCGRSRRAGGSGFTPRERGRGHALAVLSLAARTSCTSSFRERSL